MRIEFLTDIKHDRISYHKGDIITVEDKLGQYFCKAGWAKDTEGKILTETPDVNVPVYLEPQNINQPNSSEIL